MQNKTCSMCLAEKPISEFYKKKDGKYGVDGRCKDCFNALNAKRRLANPEKERLRHADWYNANKDKIARSRAKRRIENPEMAMANVARRKAKDHPEKYRSEILRASRKRQSTPRGKLDNSISSNIRDSIVRGSKAGRGWEDLVGYTIDDIMAHLERRFQQGMSWENYGRGGWHVDHIVPKSLFNYSTPDAIDFKRCWALSNLQPLWGVDNVKKYNKYEGGFQPSLALEGSEQRTKGQ